MAAPERKNQRVSKRDLLGGGRTAWVLARRSAVASQTARCGVCFRQGLEVADGDDLVLRPDPDGEGAGSLLQDGVGAVVGAVERQDNAARCNQPDEVGTQQLVWQLGQQLGTGIVPGQGKRRSIQSF